MTEAFVNSVSDRYVELFEKITGETFQKASNSELFPEKISNSLAFMFESRLPQKVTKFASECNELQSNYHYCWKDIQKRFDGKK